MKARGISHVSPWKPADRPHPWDGFADVLCDTPGHDQGFDEWSDTENAQVVKWTISNAEPLDKPSARENQSARPRPCPKPAKAMNTLGSEETGDQPDVMRLQQQTDGGVPEQAQTEGGTPAEQMPEQPSFGISAVPGILFSEERDYEGEDTRGEQDDTAH
ncbi:hypothetical protein RhiJN_24348 [Ceratobasidium sp. AG-Ba]|nr:hypothetical protein RhiJN_24348 [Ceratobasidium sp. AG-Ba]